MEEASYLMDRPVGGWSELVTNHTLDLKLAVFEERFRAIDERFALIDERFAMVDRRFDLADMEQRFGEMTWKVVTAVIAGMAVMATIFAGITALLVVLLGP